MQLFHALFILLAGSFVTAQLPNIPSCSINCFISAFQHDGCSQLTDFACHCQKPDLPNTITPCVQRACNVADQSAVSSEVVRQCSMAGHPISIPPVGGGPETTTMSMPRTSTTESGAVSSSAASATLPTVSSSGAASSSRVSHSASASASGSHVPSSPGSHSQSSAGSSSTPSPSSPLSTGSASTVKAGVAGAMIIAAAAVCVL
ncbi:hypothetical protein AbraIFM66951_008892 [Aspergillus brasiliensis]|uniref:CFEM domain-containing protein n=1 Tax=Aspergillus brasiliensis TaxID=319629 RepID=A0A9W6DNT1_9EURO|nr:hypothetical protein AbraCBS73388_010697 [Aspergillus brasiliensis]GKZ46008.1 hypothetical protein AbraIFM66951_008892 [Aspergillus brasiliensis]